MVTRHVHVLVKIQQFKLIMLQNIGFTGDKSMLRFCLKPYGGLLGAFFLFYFFTSDIYDCQSKPFLLYVSRTV